MFTHTFNHGSSDHSLKEARLCHQVPGPNAPQERTIADRGRDLMEGTGQTVAYLIGDLPAAIKKGFMEQWNGAEKSDEKMKHLRMTHEFFKVAPKSVANLIDETTANLKLPPEKIVELADHAQWLNWLDTCFDEEKGPVVTDDKGQFIKKLVLSVSKPEREQMYLQYVEKFFPASAQAKHEEIFGKKLERSGKNLTERPLLEVPANREKVINAMKGMLGAEIADVDSKAIAKTALEHHYYQTNENGSVKYGDRYEGPGGAPITPRLRNASLKEDFIKGFRASHGKTTVEELKAAGPALPLFLRGAIQQGVIDNDELTDMVKPGGPLDAYRRENAEYIRRAQVQTLDYTKADKLEREKDAKTITDIYNELPGYQKLALIALAVGAFVSTKTRPVAIGAAAVYFGMKFFAKKDRPLDDISRMLNGAMKNTGSDKFLASADALSPDKIATMSVATVNFMQNDAREEMNSSAAGMMILQDLPLSVIARSFTPNTEGDGGTVNFTLLASVSRDTKDRYGEEAANAASRFFNECNQSPTRRADMEKAFSSLFYILSQGDTKNKDNVDKVEEVMRRRPENVRHIRELSEAQRMTSDGRDAMKIYNTLIHVGHERGMSMAGLKLGDFIRQRYAASNPEPADRNEASKRMEAERMREVNEKFAKLQEFAKREPAVGYGWMVKLDRSEVVLNNISVQPFQQEQYVQNIAFSTLIEKTPEQLLEEWKKFTIETAQKTLVPPAVPAGGKYVVELRGDEVFLKNEAALFEATMPFKSFATFDLRQMGIYYSLLAESQKAKDIAGKDPVKLYEAMGNKFNEAIRVFTPQMKEAGFEMTWEQGGLMLRHKNTASPYTRPKLEEIGDLLSRATAGQLLAQDYFDEWKAFVKKTAEEGLKAAGGADHEVTVTDTIVQWKENGKDQGITPLKDFVAQTNFVELRKKYADWLAKPAAGKDPDPLK